MAARGFNILDLLIKPQVILYISPDEGGEDAEDCNCQGSHQALHWPGEVSISAPQQNDSSNTTD